VHFEATRGRQNSKEKFSSYFTTMIYVTFTNDLKKHRYTKYFSKIRSRAKRLQFNFTQSKHKYAF